MTKQPSNIPMHDAQATAARINRQVDLERSLIESAMRAAVRRAEVLQQRAQAALEAARAAYQQMADSDQPWEDAPVMMIAGQFREISALAQSEFSGLTGASQAITRIQTLRTLIR